MRPCFILSNFRETRDNEDNKFQQMSLPCIDETIVLKIVLKPSANLSNLDYSEKYKF